MTPLTTLDEFKRHNVLLGQVKVGEGRSRSHYHVHWANRGERFLTEKLDLLERLMRAGGHTHLILAGDPKLTDWWND